MKMSKTFSFRFQVSGFKNPSPPARQPETRNRKPETLVSLAPGSWLLAPSRSRRAISFAEILFAVMILGIGFIMVAAMFPVAIKQTQLTGQETNAATLATDAADMIE